MLLAMRQRVHDRVFTGCGRGKVMNPRTSRCASASLPLGAAIEAAAKALMAGQKPRACPAGAYDFATGECVTDKPRVAALRDLAERWAVAEAANIDAAAVAKLMTASALTKAARANNKRARNAADARLAANAQNLYQNMARHSARLTDAEATVLALHRELQIAEEQRAACAQNLRSAASTISQLEARLMAANARPNAARPNARPNAARPNARPNAARPNARPNAARPAKNTMAGRPPWR